MGYDDSEQRFTFVNSWGENWGCKGFGTIEYDYVLNESLCADFCCIQKKI
jgi:C1A family cysteine protease